jgi:hypothetical protein
MSAPKFRRHASPFPRRLARFYGPALPRMICVICANRGVPYHALHAERGGMSRNTPSPSFRTKPSALPDHGAPRNLITAGPTTVS